MIISKGINEREIDIATLSQGELFELNGRLYVRDFLDPKPLGDVYRCIELKQTGECKAQTANIKYGTLVKRVVEILYKVEQ